MNWLGTWKKMGVQRGYTLVEVLVASCVLGLLVISLFGAFSSGLSAVKAARDNTRATQIMAQKMETFRLLTWGQVTNSYYAPATFVDWYDPVATNSGGAGTRYQGQVTVSPAPANVPEAYRDNVRTITVRVFWTNYLAGTRKITVQSRHAQTLVARYGMQGYVYQ